MLHSLITPIAVFLFALGASYAITRPIGDIRRHIAATLLSVALGTIGGFATANMVASVSAALAGVFVGMMVAWRRRTPLGNPPAQSKTRQHRSRRPHYGVTRA